MGRGLFAGSAEIAAPLLVCAKKFGEVAGREGAPLELDRDPSVAAFAPYASASGQFVLRPR